MDAMSPAGHPARMGARDNEGEFEAARLTVRLGAIAANYGTYRRVAGACAVAAGMPKLAAVPTTAMKNASLCGR